MTRSNPFRYFNTSPEIIRLAVMMYIRFPLSLRNVEDLLHERGIDICHETVRFWWQRFGPVFACEIRRKRVARFHSGPQWRWHLDEVFVKINGVQHYMWRAIDHGSSQVLEATTTHTRSLDELSLYARRLLGEVVVMAQRLLVRQADLRIVLAGEADEELSISTAVLDDVLQATAARLAQLGLSV